MEVRRYEPKLQQQAGKWFAQFDKHLTHACTFTFKQTAGGKALTAEQVWEYWGNFCKYINRLLYKHAAKRYGKTLLILPVLHGEINGKRLHIHAAIGCVHSEIRFEKLKALLNLAWREMSWTEHVTEIKPYKDTGWTEYMLHESVRLDLHSVDITQCCIPRELQAEILS